MAAIDWSQFRAIEYAQLVRKGGTDAAASISTAMGVRLSTAALAGFGPQPEGVLLSSMDIPALTLDVEVTAGASEFVSQALVTRLRAVGVAAGGRKVFDLGRVSLSLGLRAGVLTLFERYDSATRTAPSRTYVAPTLLTVGRFVGRIWGPVSGLLEAGLRTTLLRTTASPDNAARLQGFVSAGLSSSW